MRFGMLIGALLVAAPSAAQHQLTMQASLGGGYDNHLYLESYPINRPDPGKEGGFIQLSPEAQLYLGPSTSFYLILGYSVDLRQYFQPQGGHETMLVQGLIATYLSPFWRGFKLRATATFDHLYLREDPTGWLAGSGSLRIDRALGRALRASLSYIANYTTYQLEINTSWELLHLLQLSFSGRVARGLSLEPGYTFSVIQASEGNWLLHRPRFDLTWSLPWMPVQAKLGYGIDLYNPPKDNGFVLHDLTASILITVTPWIDLYCRYQSAIGEEAYTRHMVSLGITIGHDWGANSRAIAKPQQELHIVFSPPRARVVSVVGSFNHWDPQKNPLQKRDTFWTIRVDLPSGQHSYMLWVDGTIVPSPHCQRWVADGFGGKSCIFIAP